MAYILLLRDGSAEAQAFLSAILAHDIHHGFISHYASALSEDIPAFAAFGYVMAGVQPLTGSEVFGFERPSLRRRPGMIEEVLHLLI